MIGTVGRIQKVKDHATLLRAFAALTAADAGFAARGRLAIVGDGPLLGDLRALANSLGIASTTWFPGNRTDVADVLRAFDVFALPSLNEGISNTILEAMASGLPVIATAVGGNVELVDEGSTGRLVPSGDVAALAGGNRGLRGRADRAARPRPARPLRSPTERFSLAAMVASYQRVYEELAR